MHWVTASFPFKYKSLDIPDDGLNSDSLKIAVHIEIFYDSRKRNNVVFDRWLGSFN